MPAPFIDTAPEWRLDPACLVRRRLLLASFGATLLASGRAIGAEPARKPSPMTLQFRGQDFVHRWSRNAQHEFTPPAETDLKTWNDMLTLNVHASVSTGEQLAGVANIVLANYQRRGKILQTNSKPRTATQPAEHLIVAVLGTPELLEATFARCLLSGSAGMVAVCSHRLYGKAVGPLMSQWLAENGPQIEQSLMGWDRMPTVSGLSRLPTSA